MILFDYGDTLLCEPGFDTLRGNEALMKYAVSNPQKLSAKQVNDFSGYLWEEFCGPIREIGAEFHNLNFQKLLYETLQLEFSVGNEELELIFWDNMSPGAKVPHVEEMLDYLREKNYRTGVISNIGFSGKALENRIGRLLPKHNFEFIIASSEYMVRKPNPLIFKLALSKADLTADEVWYCGNKPEFDVIGAHNAGIFPVWYRNDETDKPPCCELLRIDDWLEFIDILEELK